MDIETKRLFLLETYRVVEEHVNWLNDKHLMRFSEQQFKTHDYDTQREFLTEAMINGTPLVYDIRLKEVPAPGGGLVHDGRAIGLGPTVGSLHVHIDGPHHRADPGIMLGSEFHGKGYAQEAWEGVETYLLYKLGMRKLEAGCLHSNVSMIKVLMRAGWSAEGERIRHFWYGDKPHNLVLFGKARL